MKTYKIIRDIAIIIIALVALNQTTIIIENQNKLMHNQCVILENLESNVELSTVEPIQDTIVVLDTIIVPEYKTISKVVTVKKTILDTVKVINTIDSINIVSIQDTIITIAEQHINTTDSTAIELEATSYNNNNTFIHNNELYKLIGNRLYVFHDNNWIKPNKLKSNRGRLTPHRLNKEYLSQVQDLIKSQNTLAGG